jgi:hypothetical protein
MERQYAKLLSQVQRHARADEPSEKWEEKGLWFAAGK